MTPAAVRDLYPAFMATTIRGPQDWSMGYDVIRDAKYDPECGFMLECEADLLRQFSERTNGLWLDIGSRMGWTTAHIAQGGNRVIALDPAYVDRDFRYDFKTLALPDFVSRAKRNLEAAGLWAPDRVIWSPCCSDQYFDYGDSVVFAGVCIDGDHDAPHPLNDARNALARLEDTGVIVLHDFWAHPVRQAVQYLMRSGMKCRFYDTPAGLAVCWRGQFTPPDYSPDSAIDWAKLRRERAPDFNFEACL